MGEKLVFTEDFPGQWFNGRTVVSYAAGCGFNSRLTH